MSPHTTHIHHSFNASFTIMLKKNCYMSFLALLLLMKSLLYFVLQEHYVEYSRQGNVIKGDEKPVIRSKYEEDVHINNHTVSNLC